MHLFQIAYRSLLERKSKSLFLIIGISLSLLTIIILMTVTQFLSISLSDSIKEHGAKLFISPKTEAAKLSINGITVADERIQSSEYIAIDKIDQLNSLLQNVEHTVIEKYAVANSLNTGINNNSNNIIIVITDLAAEFLINPSWNIINSITNNINSITNNINTIDSINKMNGNQILVGYNVLNNNEFVSDNNMDSAIITLAGENYIYSTSSYTILAEQGNENDNFIFIDKAYYRENILNNSDTVLPTNVIELHLRPESIVDVEQVISSIEKHLPELQATVNLGSLAARQQLLNEFSAYTTYSILVLVIVSVFLIISTMMVSVNQRFSEFGIMRTAGYRRNKIAAIVILETIILFICSFIMSTMIGTALANIVIAKIFDQQAQFMISYITLFYVFVTGGLISIMAALFPAMKAANLDPVEAIKLS